MAKQKQKQKQKEPVFVDLTGKTDLKAVQILSAKDPRREDKKNDKKQS